MRWGPAACGPARCATVAARLPGTQRWGRWRCRPRIGGASRLVVCWGADLFATNVHFWAKVEEARKRGVQLVVIDPRRTRSAQLADWYIADPHRHRRGAGARRHAHPGARRAVRPCLSRRAHAWLRSGGARDTAGIRPGPRRFHHRHRAGGCRALRRALRPRQPLVHQARLRHDAVHLRRTGASHGCAAAGSDRCLWPIWRRRPAGDRGVVRAELQRDPQTIRAGEHAHGELRAARRGAA